MKKIRKQIVCALLVLCMAFIMMPMNMVEAKEKTTGTVFEYSPMVEEDGSIYYIKSVGETVATCYIYRMDVATGTKTKLVTSDYYILSMVIYDDKLYYTSYESKDDQYHTYSISVNGGDKKQILTGIVIYADQNGIFYTQNSDTKINLYKKTDDGSKDKKVCTGNSSFLFIKALDNTLYFSQYTQDTSVLKLYSMQSSSSKITTVAKRKVVKDKYSYSIPRISDVVEVNGNLYYQYGTHEGSGSFWYGTLVKIDLSTDKQTIISKDMIEDALYYDDSNIYFNDMKSNTKYYKYNVNTNKTTTYSVKTVDTETFSMIGSKTYLAKPDSNEYIMVSSFQSGTNKKDFMEDFIKISCKQKKDLTYSASVKSLGDYLVIPVTCIDYTDGSYGWRGKLLQVKWYVFDQEGNLLSTIS